MQTRSPCARPRRRRCGTVRRGRGQLRAVSLRCFELLRDDWLLPQAPVTWDVDECIAHPMLEPVSGSRVYVLPAAQHSPDQGGLREALRRLRSGPRGARVSVAVPMHSAAAVQAWARLASDSGHREAACGALAAAGAAPDELAEALLHYEAYGLQPHCDSAAAVAEAQRLGVACHYADRPPLQGFARVAAVRHAAADLLGLSEDDVARGLYPNQLGLHADRAAHLLPADLALLLQRPPSVHAAARLLSCLDLPSLLFRVVHPTVWMARRLRELCWADGAGGGCLLAVVPAHRAHLLRRLWQAHQGEDREAEAGVFFDFHSERPEARPPPQSAEPEQPSARKKGKKAAPPDPEFEALEGLLDEGAPAEQRQAEFEVQLALFHHLSVLRPDEIAFQTGVANVYIMHGLLRDGVEFLMGMVLRRTHPGLPEVLQRIVRALVDNGMLDPAEPLAQRAQELCDEAAEWAEGAALQAAAAEAAARPAAPAAPGLLSSGERPAPQRMIRRSLADGAEVAPHAPIPEIEHARAGELGKQRTQLVADALVAAEARALSRSEPPPGVQKQMLRQKRLTEGMQFSTTALHPLSDAYTTTPGGALPNEGVTSLPRYRPSLDFPAPPEPRSLQELHAAASRSVLDRRIAKGDGMPATQRLLADARRLQKTRITRSNADSALRRERREDARWEREQRLREQAAEQWVAANKRFGWAP
eukprot:TRINITY_DN5983_c0_g1_i1.p1 TRINITY_DN5983_c0_g1~~TRINITY_DN5983_c0_g1_i1.p1  ORF type:complete len:703 (+),score=259.22 TRINITY_DN5983_c0_g1_i1:70-2178(+)